MSATCATFLLQAKVAQDGPTSFGGHVYTDKGDALPGVRVSIGRTALSGTTDASGKFEILNIPPGRIDLFLDGRTANAQGKLWPSLHFEAYAVRGQTNELAHGIYLPPLLSGSAKTVGGAADVILTIPELDGFQMKVKANSVTFPDGSRVGTLIVSPVTADKLPMAPPAGGGRFGIPAWTIQPADTRFDPPIEVTMPNGTSQPIGDNLPVVQWDHDLSMFVPMGRATVSEDGSILVTDAGSGITKAGWGALCVYDPNKCLSSPYKACNSCEKEKFTAFNCKDCELDQSKHLKGCLTSPSNGGQCGICSGGNCDISYNERLKSLNDGTCCGPEKTEEGKCCVSIQRTYKIVLPYTRGLTVQQAIDKSNPGLVLKPADFPPLQFEGPPASNLDTKYFPLPRNGVTYAIDGCSVPAVVKNSLFPPGLFINKVVDALPPENPLAEIFYMGCEGHDICYQTCGSNQSTCDLALDAALARSCDAIPIEVPGSGFIESQDLSVPGEFPPLPVGLRLPRRYECNLYRKKMYGGLYAFGSTAHSLRQREMCVVCPK